MVISVVFIVLGFILLIKGADWLINGSTALAKKHKVSDLVIGLTIVAFGTSTPELVVNSVSSLQLQSDLVFGNIIGSNIVNLFFILGFAGLVYPITVHSNTVWKEIPVSILAVAILFILSNGFVLGGGDVLSRFDGLILLTFFGGFLYYIYIQMKVERIENSEVSAVSMSNLKIWGFILIGLAGLVLGGKLVVDNAVKVAAFLGVSNKIIGLTIVAIGTSLPELMTSVVAAFKKNSDIAIGNIIGSNIFNVFFILSISALIHPVDFNTSFNTDIVLLIAGSLVLFLAMFTGRRKKLDRWEAAILMVIYVIYIVYLISKEV